MLLPHGCCVCEPVCCWPIDSRRLCSCQCVGFPRRFMQSPFFLSLSFPMAETASRRSDNLTAPPAKMADHWRERRAPRTRNDPSSMTKTKGAAPALRAGATTASPFFATTNTRTAATTMLALPATDTHRPVTRFRRRRYLTGRGRWEPRHMRLPLQR